MELREQFEKLHPVPEGIVWRQDSYMPEVGFRYVRHPAWKVAERHTDLWQGFQSGHAAGLEAAAKFLDEWNTAIGDDLAKSIRAMKEPK